MKHFPNPPKNVRVARDEYPELPQPFADGDEPSFWWRRHGDRFEPSANTLEEIQLQKLANSFRDCLPAALAATP